MAGNNTNIDQIKEMRRLTSEIVFHLNLIEPDKTTANKYSEQTIAKENAEEWMKQFQVVDLHKLQQVYE